MQGFAKTALQTLAVLCAFSALAQVAMVIHDTSMLLPALLSGLMAYGFWRWAAKMDTTPALPRFSVTVSVVDDDEPLDKPGWSIDPSFRVSAPRPIQARLELTYQDAGGQMTNRQVDVRECDTSDPEGVLIGYCHLRNANRTFRIDRIHRAVDMETGEIIPDMNAYADNLYSASPVAALDRLFEASADALRALFYIGKADGRFTSKEKHIFLDYCHAAAGDERITMSHIEEACKWMEIPSQQAFKLICGRLTKADATQRNRILSAAAAMVATEKTVSGGEAEALDYLRDRLGGNQPA